MDISKSGSNLEKTDTPPIIVIGGGAGGMLAAGAAAQTHPHVILLEKTSRLGSKLAIRAVGRFHYQLPLRLNTSPELLPGTF